MDVGIFVTSLKPRSPSQARLQAAIFDGLSKVADGRYRFVVFSLDSLRIAVPGGFVHAPVARYGKWEELGRRLRANLCHALLRVWEFLGASGGRTWQSLTWLSRFEPKHFLQMRDHNIRLLWNMNQHELKVPVPFLRTIWEAIAKLTSQRHGVAVANGASHKGGLVGAHQVRRHALHPRWQGAAPAQLQYRQCPFGKAQVQL